MLFLSRYEDIFPVLLNSYILTEVELSNNANIYASNIIQKHQDHNDYTWKYEFANRKLPYNV